jgi:hypothetical protein
VVLNRIVSLNEDSAKTKTEHGRRVAIQWGVDVDDSKKVGRWRGTSTNDKLVA